MVALLFALFLRLSYSILIEPLFLSFGTVRSAFSSCFYGNKYTITNTEAADRHVNDSELRKNHIEIV